MGFNRVVGLFAVVALACMPRTFSQSPRVFRRTHDLDVVAEAYTPT